jgi:putative aldouronate transport system permease protein
MFRAFFAALGVGSMYFNGGIIPIYLNIRMLGLLNNFFVYIFPTLFSFFNVLILMSFFRTIPSSIEESAYMDGAGNYLIFFRLILPLSKPVIASIALFVAVFHWNSYFDSMMYTTRTELQTIQLFIVKMVRNREAAANMAQQYAAMYQDQQTVTSTTLQFATMALTSLPIILLYPFLQRYFVKGIMIGSIKG